MKEDASILQFSDLESCSEKEALTYAKKVNDWRAWKVVLARPDVPIEIAIYYAKKMGDCRISEAVLIREDVKAYFKTLSEKEAICYRQKMILSKGFFELSYNKN